MERNKRLVECGNFRELEAMVNGLGWDSTSIATKIKYYKRVSIGLKVEGRLLDAKNYEDTSEWLCLYRDLYNKGHSTNPAKDRALQLLLKNSVVDCQRILAEEGFKVSRTTLYKYKENSTLDYIDFTQGYLSDYTEDGGFPEGHPPWITSEWLSALTFTLKEYGGHNITSAHKDINGQLREEGLPRVGIAYLHNILCYEEWLDEGGYLYGEGGIPKEEYLSIFLDDKGKIYKDMVHYFLDVDGKVVTKYRHLLREDYKNE